MGYFFNTVQNQHHISFLSLLPDLLPNSEGEAPTLSFLQDVVDILLQYLVTNFDRSTKVIDFHYPNELLQEYNWELADQPQTLEEILVHCRTALKYAIKTGKGTRPSSERRKKLDKVSGTSGGGRARTASLCFVDSEEFIVRCRRNVSRSDVWSKQQ